MLRSLRGSATPCGCKSEKLVIHHKQSAQIEIEVSHPHKIHQTCSLLISGKVVRPKITDGLGFSKHHRTEGSGTPFMPKSFNVPRALLVGSCH